MKTSKLFAGIFAWSMFLFTIHANNSGSTPEHSQAQFPYRLQEIAADGVSKFAEELIEAEPFLLDRVIVTQCKRAAAELNPDELNAAAESLSRFALSQSAVSLARYFQAEFQMQVSGDVASATRIYKEVATSTGNPVSALASLRLNEKVQHANFADAVAENDKILSDHPYLPTLVVTQVQLSNAVYEYQLDMYPESKARLVRLLSQDLDENTERKAMCYLNAIETPNSPSGLQALYEKALRLRNTFGMREKAWSLFREYRSLVAQEAFQDYIADPSVPSEERATARYNTLLAQWETGQHEGVCEACDSIIESCTSHSVVRLQCLFMKAYHHAHCGDYDAAIKLYQQILTDGPDCIEVIPSTYKEILNCFYLSRRYDEAIEVSNRFVQLYPYRVEIGYFKGKLHQFRSLQTSEQNKGVRIVDSSSN